MFHTIHAVGAVDIYSLSTELSISKLLPRLNGSNLVLGIQDNAVHVWNQTAEGMIRASWAQEDTEYAGFTQVRWLQRPNQHNQEFDQFSCKTSDGTILLWEFKPQSNILRLVEEIGHENDMKISEAITRRLEAVHEACANDGTSLSISSIQLTFTVQQDTITFDNGKSKQQWNPNSTGLDVGSIVCVATKPAQQSVLAIGFTSGSVLIVTLERRSTDEVHACKSIWLHVDAQFRVGSVTALTWDRLSGALGCGWSKRGYILYDTQLQILATSLPTVWLQVDHDSHNMEAGKSFTLSSLTSPDAVSKVEPFLHGCTALCWQPDGLGALIAGPSYAKDNTVDGGESKMKTVIHKVHVAICDTRRRNVVLYQADRVVLLKRMTANEHKHMAYVSTIFTAWSSKNIAPREAARLEYPSVPILRMMERCVPADYLHDNAPLSHTCVSPDNTHIAVAGKCGLAVFLRDKWRVFGNPVHEAQVSVRAMTWVMHASYICILTHSTVDKHSATHFAPKKVPRTKTILTDEEDNSMNHDKTKQSWELLLYPPTHLDHGSLMHIHKIKTSREVVSLKIMEDDDSTLCVQLSGGVFVIYTLLVQSNATLTVTVRAMIQTRKLLEILSSCNYHKSQYYTMHWQACIALCMTKHQFHTDVEAKNDSLCASTFLVPCDDVNTGIHLFLVSENGHFVCVSSMSDNQVHVTELSDASAPVRRVWQGLHPGSIAKIAPFFLVTASDVELCVWMRHSSGWKSITLCDIDAELQPLCMESNYELAFMTSERNDHYTQLQPASIPCLQAIMHHLLIALSTEDTAFGGESMAIILAQSVPIETLSSALESLLLSALMKAAQEMMISVDLIVEFIDKVCDSATRLSIIINCARRCDAKDAETLYKLTGTSNELFEACLACGALSAASLCLTLTHRNDGPALARQQAFRLLSAATQVPHEDTRLTTAVMRFVSQTNEQTPLSPTHTTHGGVHK